MDAIYGRWLVRLAVPMLVLAASQLGAATHAAADPSVTDWSRLRICESTNRYEANTGNGYFGAYQFDLPTWRSVGGQGHPHEASRIEQDFRALYLYRMRGWQPWECAGKLGLREDKDAKSKRVPTYHEAAYIGGPSDKAPPWPGHIFKFGDCHASLREWQLRMNMYGYGFDGIGCYRDKTKQAVLDLQRANGIKDSGLLGPKTWYAAWNGRPPR